MIGSEATHLIGKMLVHVSEARARRRCPAANSWCLSARPVTLVVRMQNSAVRFCSLAERWWFRSARRGTPTLMP